MSAVTDFALVANVYSLVKEYCNVSDQRLRMDADLIFDFGCAGEDAIDLFDAICAQYDIDCTGFDIFSVFDSEGLGYRYTIFNPFYLWALLFENEKTHRPKFTIAMLIKAIKNKKLKTIKPDGYFYAKEIIIK